MILPDLFLPSRANQQWLHSGIDSPCDALDRQHFNNYPHPVTYQYNSRGFRDAEWPTDLSGAIWCLGDSFTVGLGAPLDHTWPQVLQRKLGTRTINVSMDGASNQWIARKARAILSEFQSSVMIIQWSFTTRREEPVEDVVERRWQQFYNSVKDPSWPSVSYQQKHTLSQAIQQELNELHNYESYKIESPGDDERRIHVTRESTQQDIEDTVQCIRSLQPWESSTTIIHSFIPKFIDANHVDYFFATIEPEINYCIRAFPVLDLSRDGYHYDLLTAQHFVADVIKLLNNRSV